MGVLVEFRVLFWGCHIWQGVDGFDQGLRVFVRLHDDADSLDCFFRSYLVWKVFICRALGIMMLTTLCFNCYGRNASVWIPFGCGSETISIAWIDTYVG
jgi:hypothetical protein